jgi:hypothetical protein
MNSEFGSLGTATGTDAQKVSPFVLQVHIGTRCEVDRKLWVLENGLPLAGAILLHARSQSNFFF